MLGRTFIQRFREAFSSLVFKKLLVRNFVSFFRATPKLSVFYQPVFPEISKEWFTPRLFIECLSGDPQPRDVAIRYAIRVAAHKRRLDIKSLD